MKLPRTNRSGLPAYDVQRDPIDHGPEKVLPAGPALDAVTAVCGTVIKMVLPMAFDPGDEYFDELEAERATAAPPSSSPWTSTSTPA